MNDVLVVGPVPVRRVAESPLPEANYREAMGEEVVAWRPFLVNWPVYEQHECGALLCLGAMKGGELIGYALVWFMPGQVQSMGTPAAGVDAIYVAPEHRGGRAAHALASAIVREATSRGVKEVCVNLPTGAASAARLFTGMGFTEAAAVYRKVL